MTKHSLKMVETSWAEMAPGCYGGEMCDEIEPMWDAYFDGDKEGETSAAHIVLDPTLFPPGTRVVMSVPECPECHEPAGTCDCGFDWIEWTRNTYG